MAEDVIDPAPQIDADVPLVDAAPDAAPVVDAAPDASGAKSDGTPDAPADAKKDDVVPAWGEDWRDKIAKGDAKKLARLSRYASPEAMADALVSLQNKLASTRPAVGKDATPEQVKEYREAMGIPETFDKYDLADVVPKGADMSMINLYLEKAHTTNQTPEQVKASVGAYYEMIDSLKQNQIEKDQKVMTSTEDALRQEWGDSYRQNMTLVKSFLDNAPAGLKESFLGGRMADGTPIGSSPEALRWLLSIEMERNPTGTVVPGAGANMAKSVEDELKQINDFRASNRTAYNKDEKMQARERQLIEYQLQQKKKAA